MCLKAHAATEAWVSEVASQHLWFLSELVIIRWLRTTVGLATLRRRPPGDARSGAATYWPGAEPRPSVRFVRVRTR